MSASIGESVAVFPSTHWSLLGSMVDDGVGLDRIVRRYTPALRGYLVLRRRLDFDTANEVIQEFLLEKVLTGTLLEKADPRRGRFRDLLRKALDNYLVSRHRKSLSRRNGSGQAFICMEHLEQLPARDVPRDRFDYLWARQVIGAALWRARRRCREEGAPQLWHLLVHRLVRPLLSGKPAAPYAQLMERFAFPTYSHATKAMSRAKALYVECLRETVGQYVAGAAQIDEEIRDLKDYLARSGGCAAAPRSEE